MRDILSDAEQHRGDPLSRARELARQPPVKKFYQKAIAAQLDDGFAVLLDGRPIRTPGRVPVRVPSAALAQALAAEWDSQVDNIEPATMPLTRLVNVAVEGGAGAAAELRAEIAKYAAGDLLLYRADAPRELVEAQEREWDAVLTALARHFGVGFRPTIGIIHQQQPDTTIARLAASLEGEDVFALAALVSITNLTGSGLLAIAIRQGLVDAERAWRAAHVDEDHNIRLWGEDGEAAERRRYRRAEFDAAMAVLGALD